MFIGIDIGGTHTRILGSDSLEKIEIGNVISLPTSKEFDLGIEDLISAIKKFTDNPESIVIGLPGNIDEDQYFIGSINLSSWVDKPIAQTLAQVFQCPVHLRNDAELAGLGEAYFGDHEILNYFHITWGTGIGCAQIFWHENVPQIDRSQDRRLIHELENHIGGSNIKQIYGKEASQLSDDEWEHVIQTLIDYIPKLAMEYNFSKLILGGGIFHKQQLRIISQMNNFEHVSISYSKLHGQAGVYGAFGYLRTVS